MPRGSEETRDLLLRTAVQLIAERGVEAVSLREIGIAAGQANNAVLHYYFGDRDGLLRAIVEKFSITREEAARVLRVYLSGDGRATPSDLAQALIAPLAVYLDHEPAYLRFITRMLGDRERELLLVEPPAQWFREVTARVQADLGEAEAGHRFRFAVLLTLHALADRAHAEQTDPGPETRENYLADLRTAVAAILTVPA